MLQTACMRPELLVNQNMSESEICGYSPGQGSPLPGETASPKSCFQQSPSLPDSGLTELNVASPKIYHPPPPCKPPGMPAPADSELSSDPPQKRYMGVRVKMPVRELLRKIRLSKGLDAAHSKEASSVKMVTKGSSGKTAEKRRAHPYTEKQLRQSKQSAGQSPKGLEDLDILVEVLQEDLNKSQLREEPPPPVPYGLWQEFSTDLQSSRWQSVASKEAAGGLQGRQRSSAGLHQESCLKDFHLILRAGAEPSFHGEQGKTHGSSSPGMFCRTGEKGSGWWMQDALPSSQEDFPRNSPSQDTPALLSPAEMLLEAHRGSPDTEGHSRLTPTSFTQQDLSALSFFQFQLHREESLLRNIPAEKLLAPDENGNRLLHKAVAQGRRALTFALAQRFASLNKIDEKDAEKRTALHLAAEKNQHLMVSDLISLGASVNVQDSSGKTPLHLCAENGYLRVLQVLKSCKDNGVCVEVDLPDHCGLTPLHCAALAHTVLVTESHSTASDTDQGRFLRLRKDQILEGILCLLQMGAKPELQVLNSCPISTTCLKLEENTELMCLLQTHKPQGQDVLQEVTMAALHRQCLAEIPGLFSRIKQIFSALKKKKKKKKKKEVTALLSFPGSFLPLSDKSSHQSTCHKCKNRIRFQLEIQT
ncbi:CARD- and ANK-domain containing inflammasome adapter protein-like isoform X5 [Corvus kubaryi]|uniref:CARD- and ANK-domain containing inflammasome adapter protein-like isoform X5 n=2 Tax=Corvus kubaryi TaxID=68294 RepID=UPI001C03E2DD|nr:CARD- and ANK-domain containing inflammasome adapter protein-like isoform X5 [Corvus kubaryi]